MGDSISQGLRTKALILEGLGLISALTLTSCVSVAWIQGQACLRHSYPVHKQKSAYLFAWS